MNAVSVFRKLFIDCDCNTRAIRADVLGFFSAISVGGLAGIEVAGFGVTRFHVSWFGLGFKSLRVGRPGVCELVVAFHGETVIQ